MKVESDNMQRVIVGRRGFLAGIAIAGIAKMDRRDNFAKEFAQSSSHSTDPRGSFPGLILREHVPANLEFPLPTLDGSIVSNNRFFVRCHFPIPNLNPSAWRLKIEGQVGHELELTYDELRKLPSRTIEATIECAGNSRAFLVPKARGVLWELGAVGNAKWTGVSLANVLEQAGIHDDAVEVILEGADEGEITDDPKSPGPIRFARSLPLEKARRAEVLLAYQMNGEDLSPEHGFPVRAIVPGWYGMASVKWLTRIRVTKVPFRGYWQTMAYTVWQREGNMPTSIPVTQMQVKSEIARPCLHEVLPGDANYKVSGAAWAGEANVAKVEVSTDGGQTWKTARLLGDAVPFSWRLWELDWRVPSQPGTYRVMAKATDSNGQTQLISHNRDHGGYLIHHILPVDVVVR